MSTTKSAAVTAFFHRGPKVAAATKTAVATGDTNTYVLPPTEDTVISAFYAQLTEKERIAHAIAVEKLGTSYDVSRTHGFLKWKRKQDAAAAAAAPPTRAA